MRLRESRHSHTYVSPRCRSQSTAVWSGTFCVQPRVAQCVKLAYVAFIEITFVYQMWWAELTCLGDGSLEGTLTQWMLYVEGERKNKTWSLLCVRSLRVQVLLHCHSCILLGNVRNWWCYQEWNSTWTRSDRTHNNDHVLCSLSPSTYSSIMSVFLPGVRRRGVLITSIRFDEPKWSQFD